LAISHDGGRSWQKHPQRTLALDDIDRVQIGTQCVVRDSETWRMFYTSIQEGDRYLIRYAESADGIVWKKPGENLAIDADSKGTSSRPCVWKQDNRWLMLYSRAPGLAGGDDERKYRIHLARSHDGRRFVDVGEVLGPTHRLGDFDAESTAYAWSLPDDRARFLYSGDGFGRTGIGLGTLNRTLLASDRQ
jgi:hypothetical protein